MLEMEVIDAAIQIGRQRFKCKCKCDSFVRVLGF